MKMKKEKKDDLNPKNLKYNNIITESSIISKVNLAENNNNIMVLFNSIDDILYVIYSRGVSIILFNINDNKKSLEIKVYNRTILFNYYFDKINKRDLLATIDSLNIKLWNVNNFECLCNIIISKDLFQEKSINRRIQTLFFINNKNDIYINIVFPHYNLPIHVYDLDGNEIKKIKINLKQINHMDSFSDKNKSYFFACGYNFVKSFDFKKNELYKSYASSNDKKDYTHVVINDYDIIKKLIGCNMNGDIKIWNFHSGQLLSEIKIMNNSILSICLWNKDYLFAACQNNPFVLINLKNKKISGIFGEKEDSVMVIKKGNNDKCGKCLITQHIKSGKIKLWLINH